MFRTPLLVIALLVLPLASGATQLTAHITRLLIAKKRVAAVVAAAAAAADPVPFEPQLIEPVLPAGAAQLAWATPLLRFDVGKGEAGGSAERLNSELRAAVLADFDAFRQQSCPAEGAEGAAGEEAGCGGGDPANAQTTTLHEELGQVQVVTAQRE